MLVIVLLIEFGRARLRLRAGARDNGYHRTAPNAPLARETLPAQHLRGPRDNHSPFQEHALRPDESDDAIPGGKMGRASAGLLSRHTGTGARCERPRSVRCLSALRIHLPATRD